MGMETGPGTRTGRGWGLGQGWEPAHRAVMRTGLILPGAVVPITPHPTLSPPHAWGPPGVPADVDECQEHGAELCGAERCENLPGSYRCVPPCQPGYRPRDGGGCEGTGP